MMSMQLWADTMTCSGQGGTNLKSCEASPWTSRQQSSIAADKFEYRVQEGLCYLVTTVLHLWLVACTSIVNPGSTVADDYTVAFSV